ncbi:sigma factor, partial [Streptomyces sp. MBT28]
MKEAVHIGRNPSTQPDLQQLIREVALGDQDSFAAVYDAVAGPVLGVVRAVLRDQAQSEEVAQEVLVEVWRTAPRYRPERGTVINWILTLAHRRAVDRVRSVEAAVARDHKAALLDRTPEYDEVTEQVETRLEREQVRRCLRTLTEIQR